MSDNGRNPEVPQEFWDVADAFIDLANQLMQEWPVTRVSAAMMYATARFNAFAATVQGADGPADRDEVVEYFSHQYRTMFVENLDDHLGGAEG